MKKWEKFEKVVTEVYSNFIEDNSVEIIKNAKITGHITGRKRQIDLLIKKQGKKISNYQNSDIATSPISFDIIEIDSEVFVSYMFNHNL